MTHAASLMRTDLPLADRRAGKVRDLYRVELPESVGPALAIVATDRISAFDVVMPNGIPGKGVILNTLSHWWFERLSEAFGDDLPHHVISTDPADLPGLTEEQRRELAGRLTLGRATRVIPIECVARGYLAGSGWKEYQRSGSVCGVDLPPGLRKAQRLPEPIFTPTTKAEAGHDEPVTFDEAANLVGAELMQKLRRKTLAVYRFAHDLLAHRGLILADTKLEFGLLPGSDQPMLIDEALTPDSSRYWPMAEHQPGAEPPSFDKQFVRNHLQDLVDAGLWDKTPPAPALPAEVVRGTQQRYAQAFRLITGQAPPEALG
jgi:phosphoribosylaminoimidazole-succinocarboxamide synthase